ncbi:MAG TPA: MFS transporter [Casimicrobiaceae bacterium]|nr:MFS transporter [Casimicrobiaceae bacterium]
MNTSISHSPARQKMILATCCLSLLVVAMDATIVNVALPDIRRDLDASLSGLQWVIDAYTIVLASFLMLGGSSADRFGRRRVFQIGLSLFTLASLACSLATSVGWLVAARVVQALGGSMMNPVAMSIIVHTFHDPKARARAIGVWGAVAGVSMALGPLAGGALTQQLGWHAIFWINVPIGMLALGLTAKYVPESRAPRPRRPDPVGQALLLIGLAALAYAAIESGRGVAVATAASLLGALAFAGLVAYELRRREPLLDPRFFHSLPFSAATVIAVCMFAALGGFLFLSSLYLQEVRGLSAFRAGLCILPAALAVMIVSPLSGRLVGSHGARPSLLVSGSTLALSAMLLAQLQAQTPLAVLLPVYALFGVGFGMVNAPITFAAVSGMPRAQAGLASAVASTSRQIGVAAGVALAGALTSGFMGHTSDAWSGFPQATHSFWWILVGFGALVVVLSVLSTGARARASTERIAHLLREPDAGAAV